MRAARNASRRESVDREQRRGRGQVAAFADPALVRDQGRFVLARALPVGAAELELGVAAAAQLRFQRAQAAVVQVAVDLGAQPRPGGVDTIASSRRPTWAPSWGSAHRRRASSPRPPRRIERVVGRVPAAVADHPRGRFDALHALMNGGRCHPGSVAIAQFTRGGGELVPVQWMAAAQPSSRLLKRATPGSLSS